MSKLEFAHYGELRDRIATEDELRIFEILKEISGADLELVRKSDNYVSAVLGDWDLARIKYTPRAKWIQFPLVDIGSAKHKLTDPEDVRELSEAVFASLKLINS